MCGLTCPRCHQEVQEEPWEEVRGEVRRPVPLGRLLREGLL